MPDVYVWEAVALSLDIEPEMLEWDRIKAPLFNEEAEFNGRLTELLIHLSNDEYFPTPTPSIPNMSECYMRGLKLSEFACFAANRVQWEIPEELRSIARKIAASGFSVQDRARFIDAEYWTERELLGLCFGVSEYYDRDDIAPEAERNAMKEKIKDGLKSGALACEHNPDATPANSVYGGVWRIRPAKATVWALAHSRKFPEWLVKSKQSEIYAQQAAEKKEAGRYTLQEAAEEIERNIGERFGTMIEKLKAAVSAGALVVYEPGRNARYLPKTVRDFYEEARTADLNRWLAENELCITFRFPEPDPRAESAEMEVLDKSVMGGAARASDMPPAIPSSTMAMVFCGLRWAEDKWRRYLADPPKWLERARVDRGKKGAGNAATWNPVIVAVYLCDKKQASKSKLKKVFDGHKAMKAWASEWEDRSKYFSD
ncbi:hypothetical protein QS306_05830 [Paraburkholderia bonniea]|uniref:hypothetical protein n=1 Tax=Paraburkholderia bonniea TaxID=2152891 RepID=UPI00257310C7|nr:hypothetical protein [Paraburkholderia bonniea]WJF91155.1 hypothetical protein QS306_05830 [Paraburkholderia bonniea]WJF94470.1 hypothetical protein QS308_05835 [Paraburkholderia bonniea]